MSQSKNMTDHDPIHDPNCTHPDCVFEQENGYDPGDPLFPYREEDARIREKEKVMAVAKSDEVPDRTFDGSLEDAFEQAMNAILESRLTINEARLLVGLPSISGGDVYVVKVGSVPWVDA